MKGLGVVFCVLCLAPASADGRTASNDGVVGPDCGINALYVLMSLEDRPVSLERLASALPPSHPEGYSMAEPSAAARSLGLTLKGIKLAKAGARPDRPVIGFMKQNGRGHFAVLRPVGTTGTMVQVIDPPYPPQFIDYERLLELDNWTGRALIASTIWTPSLDAVLISGVAGAVACSLAASRRRWRRLSVV